MITLVLGGARSGKSRFAEGLAESWYSANANGRMTYIATAEILDQEMDTRVKGHQERRADYWQTIEEPVYLPSILRSQMDDDHLILVDCLTLWLSNVLMKSKDCDTATNTLCDLLKSHKGRLILVSNEVGLGIVPDNKLARQFRDAQGIANQRVAEVADEVVFVAAGLPSVLKSV